MSRLESLKGVSWEDLSIAFASPFQLPEAPSCKSMERSIALHSVSVTGGTRRFILPSMSKWKKSISGLNFAFGRAIRRELRTNLIDAFHPSQDQLGKRTE